MTHGAFQWPLRTFLLTVAFQFLAGNSFATSLLASHEYLGTDRFLMLGDTLWGELVGTVITPDSRRRGYDELVDGIAGIRHFHGLVERYGLSARLWKKKKKKKKKMMMIIMARMIGVKVSNSL